jgi:hypothetical protein
MSMVDQAVLDFDQLVIAQRDIWEKYDDPIFYEFRAMGNQKELIRRLDKYILHTVEEIAETMDETEHTESHLSEMVDIILYAATITSILKLCLKNNGTQYFGRNILPNAGDSYDKDYMNNALRFIVGIRRNYPERKWHKSHPYPDYTECINRARNSYRMAVDAALCIAYSAASMYGGHAVIEEITRKQKEVVSLKPIEGLSL